MASHSSRRKLRPREQRPKDVVSDEVISESCKNFQKVSLVKEFDGVVLFYCCFKDGSRDWLALSDFEIIPEAVTEAYKAWTKDIKRRKREAEKKQISIIPITADIDIIDDNNEEAELSFQPKKARMEIDLNVDEPQTPDFSNEHEQSEHEGRSEVSKWIERASSVIEEKALIEQDNDKLRQELKILQTAHVEMFIEKQRQKAEMIKLEEKCAMFEAEHKRHLILKATLERQLEVYRQEKKAEQERQKRREEEKKKEIRKKQELIAQKIMKRQQELDNLSQRLDASVTEEIVNELMPSDFDDVPLGSL